MSSSAPPSPGHALDLSDPSKLDRDDPTIAMQLYREYLSAMFVLVKSGLIFELNNPTLHNACDRAARIANIIRDFTDGEAEIEFLGDGVYVNHDLVKLDGSAFENGEYLQHVWASFDVGSISAIGETDRQDWMELITEFRRFLIGQGSTESLPKIQFQRIRLRKIEDDGHGSDLAVTDRFRTLRAYTISCVVMKEILQRMAASRRIRVVEVKRPLQELITVCADCTDLLMALVHMKRNKEDVHHHLVNTAALTVVMALSLKIPRVTISEIAIQAALHDVGRLFFSDDELSRDAHRAEQDTAIETICRMAHIPANNMRRLGRMIVANEVRMAQDACPSDAGYPFSLGSSSRLIAVAHAYDLLTSPTRKRPAFLPDEALRIISAEAGRRYDETAVRLLVNALGTYPVGSVVALSNGQRAIIVEAPRGNAGPDRPRLKIVADSSGTPMDGAIVDLAGREGSRVRIVGCIDAEEEGVNAPAFLLG